MAATLSSVQRASRPVIIYLAAVVAAGFLLIGAFYLVSLTQIEIWGTEQLLLAREHSKTVGPREPDVLGRAWMISSVKVGDPLLDDGLDHEGQAAPRVVVNYYRDHLDDWQPLTAHKVQGDGCTYLAMRGFGRSVRAIAR